MFVIENKRIRFNFLGLKISVKFPLFLLRKYLYNKIIQSTDFYVKNIFLLLFNSGEVYVFLMLLRLSGFTDESLQKSLFVATKKYHIDLIKMFFPSAHYTFLPEARVKRYMI